MKREMATIGFVSIEWASVDVDCGTWWYVTILNVPHDLIKYKLNHVYRSSWTPSSCKPIFKREF
jgi:hypothetical protein